MAWVSDLLAFMSADGKVGVGVFSNVAMHAAQHPIRASRRHVDTGPNVFCSTQDEKRSKTWVKNASLYGNVSTS